MYRGGARMIAICNACRYCEGYCAVFPGDRAAARVRRDDLDTWRTCATTAARACYACQYAPPHEFAAQHPADAGASTARDLRDVRLAERLWDAVSASAGADLDRMLAGSLALFFALGIAWRGDGFFRAYSEAGSFYAIFPHNFLIAIFGLSFVFACVAITMGALVFGVHGPQLKRHRWCNCDGDPRGSSAHVSRRG